MKNKTCPKCGSTEIGDKWCMGRKLQYYCCDEDCNWTAKPRIPTKRPIKDTKELCVDDFSGWDYIIYDKYGYESTISRSYGSEKDAMKFLERELANGAENDVAGPYTAVLFKTPTNITIKGKMFKLNGGVCKKVN